MNQPPPAPNPEESDIQPGGLHNPVITVPFARKGSKSRKCSICRENKPLSAFIFAPDTRCEGCLSAAEKDRLQAIRENREPGKQCPVCKHIKPSTQFPFPNDPRCFACQPKESREDKRLKQLEKVRREFAEVLDATGGAEVDVPRMDKFISGLLREFGGLHAFLRDFAYHFSIAKQQRPGSQLVLNTYLAIAKLYSQAAKLQQEKDVAQMTDEQLEKERALAVTDLLVTAAKSESQTRMLKSLLLDNDLEPTPETIDALNT